jgi:hypothetical protein
MRSLDLGNLDKFELLASYGKYPVAIMGNPQAADFELVALDGVNGLEQKIFAARGLRFIGIIAILDSGPRTAFAELLDDAMIDTLAAAYAHSFLEQKDTRTMQPGDSLRFLDALWQLHDPRPDNH